MNTQYDLFDRAIEERRQQQKRDVITCERLTHSIVDCHRVEDEMWNRLGCEASSRKVQVLAALDRLGPPPAWCAQEAWERIAASMRSWASACGDMKLYWQLRWKREK